MKGIKIILGIIILLSLIFFGTGLFVKETVYTSEVLIDKPLNEVFSKFNKVESLQEWLPEIKKIEVINKNPQRIGSRYKIIIANQGKELEMKQKILAFVTNEKVTYSFTSEDMLKVEDYIFITQGNVTKVIQNSRIRCSSFILACTFPWFKSRFQELSQQNLNNFKAIFK